MKSKHILYILIPLICFIGVFIYFSAVLPKGDSLESREALLDNAISKGSGWTIAKETEINNHIISCAYSSDGRSAIAVFEPLSGGKYKFSTSAYRDNENIIVCGASINGEWYDLIWFNGAQTEYAEIVYTVNGATKEALKYDTTDMDLIYIKNTEKDYSLEVCYYDSEGNKYE